MLGIQGGAWPQGDPQQPAAFLFATSFLVEGPTQVKKPGAKLEKVHLQK